MGTTNKYLLRLPDIDFVAVVRGWLKMHYNFAECRINLNVFQYLFPQKTQNSRGIYNYWSL